MLGGEEDCLTLQCEGFHDGVIGEMSPFFAGDEPFVSLRMGLSKFATRELDTTKKEDLRTIINPGGQQFAFELPCNRPKFHGQSALRSLGG